MSSGAVELPLPLQLYWMLGKCEFVHETAIYLFPPNLDVKLEWAPAEPGKVFLIFALTFGRLRDYATGEIVTTDEVGFWHRGKFMKLHWDPAVESVASWSPIILLKKNGKSYDVDVMPVEDFFEKLPGEPYSDGKHEIKDVKDEIYTFNYGKGTKFTRILRVFRHKYKGPIVRVVATGGLVDVSPGHSLIRPNGQSIKGSEVKPGDKIVVTNLRYLRMNDDWNSTFIGTNELAWLYGFFTAEGCLFSGEETRGIVLYNKDLNLIERAREICEKNFHRKPSLNKCKDGDYRLTVHGKYLHDFFKENFYTLTKEKKVPTFILNASKDVKKAFLEGYFAGDGLRNPKSELEQKFATDSQTLAQGIILLWHSVYGTSFRVYDREGYPRTIQVAFNSDRLREGIKAICEKCGYEQWVFPESEEIRCKKCRSRKMKITEERKILPWSEKKPRGLVRHVKEMPYDGWLYDVETEDPHTFTTGVGPVKVHNSILGIVYPHVTPVTREEPFEVRWVNRTDRIFYADVSVWYFEFYERDYREFLQFVRGVSNFFRLFGRFATAEEAETIFKGVR